jgi:hypothetical protein
MNKFLMISSTRPKRNTHEKAYINYFWISSVCGDRYFMRKWGGRNGAICVASRAMLITGRYIWDAHSYEDHQKDMDQDTEADLLSKGKNHSLVQPHGRSGVVKRYFK